MNLRAIIDDIAGRADDFLAGADSRKEARAGVDELINADYPQLGPAERRQAAEAVMAILEKEGFFDFGPAGDESDAGSDDGE